MRTFPSVLSCLLALSTAHAAGLDPNFGSGGKLLPNLGAAGGSQANSAILQADGKIVIVGCTPAAVASLVPSVIEPNAPDYSRDFLVVRLNSDGSLDSTFGSGGTVRVDFDKGDDRAQGIAQQPDGKLVVVGSATIKPGDLVRGDTDLAVVRLLPNGELDAGFGSEGKVTINLPGDPNAIDPTLVLGNMTITPVFPPDIAYSVVVQSDGKLLIGGTSDQSNLANPHRFGPFPTLTRLTANGAVDTTFGSNNTGTLVLEYVLGAVYSIAPEPGGAVLVTTASGPAEIDAAGHLATFLGPPHAGDPASFGDFAVAPQSDGRILFGGGRYIELQNGDVQRRWMLTRIQAPQTPDTTFGTAGTATGPDGFYEQFLTSLAVDPAGKILAGGVISSGPDALSRQDALILRLQSDGTPDSNFATQGALRTDFSDSTSQYSYRQAALLRQSDGKLLMVGNRGTLIGGNGYDPGLAQDSVQIAIARFNSTPQYAVASDATTVSNTAGSVSLQVNRTGATTNSVSVSYATVDGTAAAGTDYTATSGTLTWLPTDADSKTLTIPITNNGLSSGSRAFSVVLSNPSDGSIASSSISVKIQDNAPTTSTANPPDSSAHGGGGGGSIDWLLLAALAAATGLQSVGRITSSRTTQPGS